MFGWLRRPTSKEVVDAVLEKYVTPEQLQRISDLCKERPIYEEIIWIAESMKPKYSIKRSLVEAEKLIRWIQLDEPQFWDRTALRHVFTKNLLKG